MRKINIFPNIFNYQTQKTTSVGNDTLYLLQEGCFTFFWKNKKSKHFVILHSQMTLSLLFLLNDFQVQVEVVV